MNYDDSCVIKFIGEIIHKRDILVDDWNQEKNKSRISYEDLLFMWERTTNYPVNQWIEQFFQDVSITKYPDLTKNNLVKKWMSRERVHAPEVSELQNNSLWAILKFKKRRITIC